MNGTLAESEYAALYDFYNATDGADWLVFRGAPWQFSTIANPCTQNWQGITCELSNTTFNVVELSLPDRRLTGTLPASITNLTYLQFLNVSNNELSGTIPNFPVVLEFLHLARNKFTGSIPTSFGNLMELRFLTLSSPSLTGTLPRFLVALPQLSELTIYNTDMSGFLPDFPTNSSIHLLVLIQNRLSGTIPESVGRLPRLQLLELIDTYLHGYIPSSLGSVPVLSSVSLINNLLSGALPSTICSPNITGLYLEFNMFSGTLPAALRNMTQLEYIDLSNNQLH